MDDFYAKGKKWDRDNLASLRHIFLVIPMPIQQEIFICPAEDRNLSEVVILVTNEAFLHGNEYVHAVACTCLLYTSDAADE